MRLAANFENVVDLPPPMAPDGLAAHALSASRSALGCIAIGTARNPCRDRLQRLVGLAAVTRDGAEIGTVIAVRNYGAGDLLEIAPKRGETLLVPFTRAVVPEVDLAAARVTVDPPEGLLDRD